MAVMRSSTSLREACPERSRRDAKSAKSSRKLGVRLPRFFLRGCVFAVQTPSKSEEPELQGLLRWRLGGCFSGGLVAQLPPPKGTSRHVGASPAPGFSSVPRRRVTFGFVVAAGERPPRRPYLRPLRGDRLRQVMLRLLVVARWTSGRASLEAIR